MVGKIEGEANERSRKGFTVFTAFIPSPVGPDSVVHCREPPKQLGKGEQGSVCAANEAQPIFHLENSSVFTCSNEGFFYY